MHGSPRGSYSFLSTLGSHHSRKSDMVIPDILSQTCLSFTRVSSFDAESKESAYKGDCILLLITIDTS
jgi:hypothetical protein